MPKRKIDTPRGDEIEAKKSKKQSVESNPIQRVHDAFTIQIVAGSYDRVLHGMTAKITVPPSVPDTDAKDGISLPAKAEFSDTFLFNAHTSAIRCLALSQPSAPVPGQTQKVFLATGSTDERINVYNLSAHPPSTKVSDDQKLLNALTARSVSENPKNRELGTLLHHSSTVTRLTFPVRSKLLSSSDDSTVAVTRTRDWNVLHAFKCPVPKVMGRPSGDTAALGGVPSGVNDFAVHPSMTIMITVSKGERCMRLRNLVTGKKAGVHNFKRHMLMEIGEGKHSTGEGRRIIWGSSGGEDEFAVGFNRDIVVFGMDIKPKCKVMRTAGTKANEFRYMAVDGDNTLLAVSTDDGRILFFSTKLDTTRQDTDESDKEKPLPDAICVAQLGGKDAGVSGRIKDFVILPVVTDDNRRLWYVVTGSSDGKLRVWQVNTEDLKIPVSGKEGRRVGNLVGTYETPNRITCIGAFVMTPRPDGAEESEYEFDEVHEDSDENDTDGGK